MRRARLYLRLGDRVAHSGHEEWGVGEVIEERSSTLPGGTCMVRIRFEDGEVRAFMNDMGSELCCYYRGVLRLGSGRR